MSGITRVLATSLIVLLAACGGGDNGPTTPPPPAADALRGVSVAPSTETLIVGTTTTLVPTADRASGSVTVTYSFTSSAPLIASVTDGGVVTGVAPGAATITVSATGTGTGLTTSTRTTTANISVVPRQPAITALTLSPDSTSRAPGETVTLTPSVVSAAGAAVSYSYSSSAPAVASVSNAGVVTALTGGSAIITVTASGSGTNLEPSQRTATSTIVVIPPPALTSLTISADSIDVIAFRSGAIAFNVARPNGSPAPTITTTASAAAIATASIMGNDSIRITGVVPGTTSVVLRAVSAATPTFAATALEQIITVRVLPAPAAITALSVSLGNDSLVVGASRTLVATPTLGDPEVSVSYEYSSSATAVASVSDAGAVTAIAPGTSTITITAQGSGATFTTVQLVATLNVTVLPPPVTLGIGFDDSQFEFIPFGTFVMGMTNGDGDELPLRNVTLNQYYLQKTEVTQAQWRQIMTGTGLENPSTFSTCGDTCPVEGVSYEDIQIFLSRLNAQVPGKAFRLPTEAEWEYAARAGTTGDFGGNGVLDDMGWWINNANNRTWPVAQKLPNAWGFYDMHGNVWEWVRDWYGAYPAGAVVAPIGPLTGSQRVQRGGSFQSSNSSSHRSGNRGMRNPTSRASQLGFRLARPGIS